MKYKSGFYAVSCITALIVSIQQHDCSAFIPHYHRYSAKQMQIDYCRNHECNTFTASKRILMGKKDDEDDSTPVEKKDIKDLTNKVSSIWRTMLTKLINLFPTLRLALTSFTVGAM